MKTFAECVDEMFSESDERPFRPSVLPLSPRGLALLKLNPEMLRDVLSSRMTILCGLEVYREIKRLQAEMGIA